LYSVEADGSGLKAISEDKLPEDLENVTDPDCTLTYNHSDRGVYIHFGDDAEIAFDWFYDTTRDAFWPFVEDEPDTHVLLGPFRLGGDGNFGRVLRLLAVIAADSEDVTW
jgi:hypothetical protein